MINSRSAFEFNGVSVELNSPLNDAAVGLFVAENVPQRDLGDHGDLVILEVVLELARRNQNCI